MAAFVRCSWMFVVALLLFCSKISGAKSDGTSNDALIFSTKECFLKEPVYGHTFDFSGLHSDLDHIVTSDQGDTFEFNICGNSTRTCDGHKDVAACLKRGSKEYVLGTQQLLNYRNGQMYFSFSDGSKCANGGQYQLHVSVACDYTLDTKQAQVTGYADNACSFYITLETPAACLPEPEAVKSNTCSVQDPHTGYTYNLLPLSDMNYRATDRNGSAFIINVCKPVLYGQNAMCPPGSSVCFLSLNSTNFKEKYYNYGTVQANPTIENDRLIMRHPSTTPCNSTHNYTSTIYFSCDKEARNGRPEFWSFRGCSYEFSFVTPLACSNVAPCTVITHGNEILDLSSLKGKPTTLKLQDKSYTFAVCGNAGAPCLETDGSCFTGSRGQTTSLGRSNSHLRFNQTGVPFLLYEDGASCQKSVGATAAATTSWSTRIEFVCADDDDGAKDNPAATTASGSGGAAAARVAPKIIENSNCQLLVHYPTKLACREQITCMIKGYEEDEAIDLTPLISATENYEARIDSSLTEKEVPRTTKFFLNVCRPLVSKFGLGCPGGSAACMAKVDGGSPTPEDELSLGFPMVSLSRINRTTVALRYLKGSTCPTDKDSQLSAGIEFYCQHRAGRGSPVLKAIIDCHYQFEWPTNLVCLPHACSFDNDSCELVNDELSERHSLRTAPYTTADGKLEVGNGTSRIDIDLCEQRPKARAEYARNLVSLFLTVKGPCGLDGKVNVQVRLVCSHEEQRDTLFSDGTLCNLIHTQRTPSICKFLGLAVPDASTTSTTTTTSTSQPAASTTAAGDHPAERTGSIGVVLTGLLSAVFFVACVAVLACSPRRRHSLRRCFRRSPGAVRYSRVEFNEEANLLMEPSLSDSDDDMLL